MPEPSPPPPDPLMPYAGLTPATVLDALDAVGLRGDGRLLQLNSYENRVFQVMLEDGRAAVAKFYRPGRWSDAQILEEHDFSIELAQAEIPVVPPLSLPTSSSGPAQVSGSAATLACWRSGGASFRFAVAERRSGRAPELEDPATLEWTGRFIGRLHAVGSREPFNHRLTLDVDTLGSAPRDWLLEHDIVAPDAAAGWTQAVDQALGEARRAFDRAGTVRRLRLHGDCHPGNLLWSESGPHFVDLDDAMTGPAMQDLWMLLSGDRGAMTRQLHSLLDGYRDFMDFDPHEAGLVEALRTLRMIHHSAWLARRWSDPAFPIAFPWFGGPSYWADQTVRLREQIEAMREPPLTVVGH